MKAADCLHTTAQHASSIGCHSLAAAAGLIRRRSLAPSLHATRAQPRRRVRSRDADTDNHATGDAVHAHDDRHRHRRRRHTAPPDATPHSTHTTRVQPSLGP